MNQAQLNTGVLAGMEGAASGVGTTFSDLLLGTYTNPWWLVLMAVLSALAGMVTHWFKAYYSEDKSFNFYLWFFKVNAKGTVLSLFSMLGALFATFAPLDYTMITAWQVLTQAWTIGYAADSFFGSKTKEMIHQAQCKTVNGEEICELATDTPSPVAPPKPQYTAGPDDNHSSS